MSQAAVTAVSFTLLAWVLVWWVAFELWPELRAAKLRLLLRRMQAEQSDPELFELCDRAVRHAEELRWLPLLLSHGRDWRHAGEERVALEIVRHAAFGAPWLWPALQSEAGWHRWMRRALGLLHALE